MAWIKVESSVARNRKFVKAGPAAAWLWVCGLAYCQEGLTDGYIPSESIDYLGVRHASRLAISLVLAGLWDVADGGWNVHDYLEHNKPAVEVRRIQHERREGGKKGGRPTLDDKPSGEPKDNLQGTLTVNPSTSTATATETATSTATASSRARTTPIQSPRRKDAAFEGARVYVPQRKHTDFIALRNHPGAERELFDWYAEVAQEWATGSHAKDETGADMIVFWVMRYNERWPATVVPTPAVEKTDMHGHLPPCRTRDECNRRHFEEVTGKRWLGPIKGTHA